MGIRQFKISVMTIVITGLKELGNREKKGKGNRENA
jgi:hypothetical protein